MKHETAFLDSLSLPLQGEHLIEASAGTGKTFTITILYLRLLLGLGGRNAFLYPLGVKDILIVTFTELAAAEIRNRIRNNIRDLRFACIRQSTDNPLLKSLLNEIKDKHQAVQWLLLAEQQMDEVAIFTIHGFCQRMLSLHAFESGMLYEWQLIDDESELRYQACADFWRRLCYSLPYNIAKIVHKQWKNPTELLHTIDSYLQGKAPNIKSIISSKEDTLISRHEKNLTHIIKLKKRWLEYLSEIRTVINNSNIDRRKLNKVNQEKWIEKINIWAQEETSTYELPNKLKKFSQRFLIENTKPGGVAPEHPLFTEIDNVLKAPLTLNDLIIIHAIKEIREIVSNEKRHLGALGFDDILSRLDSVLNSKSGESLATAIRTNFPVAMIDEFQDTDAQQYRIFRRIWHHQPKSALILIGDPKQAIYAFRGADIFTYIKARREIKTHYTLDTNWRSAPGIVTSINMLFTRIEKSFIFREIPFLPVKSAEKNIDMRFEYNKKVQPAMSFFLMDGEGYNVEDYQIFMARQAAQQIRDWLTAGTQGEALLWQGDISQPVKASSIAVLIRSHKEAALIRDALTLLGIPSVYLSNRANVFDTLEAQEMLWLLQAILSPEQEGLLRRALACSMLGLTALDIDFINNDDSTWDTILEEFTYYRERWQSHGVAAMLHELIKERKIAENMLASPEGERRLTDLLHIKELLQEASFQLESQSALIRWLIRHITRANNNAANQQIRLVSDKNLVQIVTIHKSKGLEYPIIWLPFISKYHTKKGMALYHDRVSFEPILDLNQDAESMHLAEDERLAEDLRLLYVALTRSVWHCSLGIAPIFQRRKEKTGVTDFHRSAIGFLIQKGEPKDYIGLRDILQSLCNKHIALHIPNLFDNSCLELSNPTISSILAARTINRKIVDDWRVTSYSDLKQSAQNIIQQDFIPKYNLDPVSTSKFTDQSVLTPHQFPRGTSSGIFLHEIFKDLNFTKPICKNWVMEMLNRGGYKSCWQPMLSNWLISILKVPLNNHGFSLNKILLKDKQVEMEFCLPVNRLLKASTLDALMRKYDSISNMCPLLDFDQMYGMIKGFIDLIFYYNGRFYLLDYKSNWLGENSQAYNIETMTAAICSHRYDLQYQLYTLALHRYLRHRITDYCYETHFGQVIYLFLRGINTNEDSGIFITRPRLELIKGMDLLFSS